jgi:hypothetical protein
MGRQPDFIGRIYCPLKERFAASYAAFEDAYNKTHSPKLRGVVPMGSCGTDMHRNIGVIADERKLPSVLAENGYGEFFTDGFLEDDRKRAWFSAPPPPARTNPLFRGLSLADPKGLFTVYGAMPYVLAVNHKKLAGRRAPRRIADLAAAGYEKAVGVNYAPDDITELLLMETDKEGGEAGIRQLARNIGLAGNAQTLIASALGRDDGCCVYLLSWFFAQAAPKRDEIEIVWPEDGALLCPLYVLAKRDMRAAGRAALGFLFGREWGQVMADAWFAHVNAEVLHRAPPGARFRWVGWDYLYEMDFTTRIRGIERIFYEEVVAQG